MKYPLLVAVLTAGLAFPAGAQTERPSAITAYAARVCRGPDLAGPSNVSCTATPAAPEGYKEPGIAILIAVLVPGGGHLYTGEVGKGLTLLAVGYGGIAAGDVIGISSGNAAPIAVGALAYLGAWIYGIADAGPSANRVNALHGLGSVSSHVSPVAEAGFGGTMNLGLSLH